MKVVPLLAALATAALLTVANTSAQAARHHHYRHHRVVDRLPVHVQLDCDNNGRCVSFSTATDDRAPRGYTYGGGIVGGRPAGCPHAFCGCGVSLKVFGKIIPELNLAANWYRFPRTSAAAGMVAIFGRHHVAYIESVDGNGNATLYDPNSGGHQTRIHQRSIVRAIIVNPHGMRVASR